MKCKALKKGQSIGVYSLSSPMDRDSFTRGLENLENSGYPAVVPLDPCQGYASPEYMFSCAAPEERARAFMQLIEDDSVGALISARGGFGAAEVLPHLDLELIAKARKPIVGYSDNTSLLVAVTSSTGLPTIHGPMLRGEFAAMNENAGAGESVAHLFSVLGDPDFRASENCEVLREGNAEAPAVVGNLTMLGTLLGTPWDVSYDGKILFIEDIGEPPYKTHRLLTQFKQSGKWDNLAGLVFCRFSDSDHRDGATLEEVLANFVSNLFRETTFPVLTAFPLGHPDGDAASRNLAVSLGCQIKIQESTVSLVESPVE